MKFRTEIEIPRVRPMEIDHGTSIMMLGSCFTDNIGCILEQDGFDVVHNPLGPLYNPLSLLRAFRLADRTQRYQPLYVSHDDLWHCMDFATRYTNADINELKIIANDDIQKLGSDICRADVIILTFGTAFVYYLHGEDVVGNCHKLPADMFSREMLSVDQVTEAIEEIVSMFPDKRFVFTISPIRHIADTLHGNQLSKSTLQLGVDRVIARNPHRCFYFPAYEIVIDDLRDYRFCAADMKHPSDTAINYIYEIFSQYFFTSTTIEKSRLARKQSKRLAHKPINQNATSGKQDS